MCDTFPSFSMSDEATEFSIVNLKEHELNKAEGKATLPKTRQGCVVMYASSGGIWCKFSLVWITKASSLSGVSLEKVCNNI